MTKITSKRRRTENSSTMITGQQDAVSEQKPVEKPLSQRDIRLNRRQKKANELSKVATPEPFAVKEKLEPKPVEEEQLNQRTTRSDLRQNKAQDTPYTTNIDENVTRMPDDEKKNITIFFLPKRRKTVLSIVSIAPALIKYEIVWAHVRGYPLWPGVIQEETPKGKYKIHFFGDYSTSELTKNKIKPYLDGYKQFMTIKPSQLLVKAVEESKMFLFEENRPTSCYICQMFEMKRAEKM